MTSSNVQNIFFVGDISEKDQAFYLNLLDQSADKDHLLSETEQGRKAYDKVVTNGTQKYSGVTVQQQKISDVDGFLVTPEQPSSIILLYIHGGGYITGSAEAYVNFVTKIVSNNHINAFVVDYTLSPEAVYPHALDQVQAVYDALYSKYDGVFIAGDSAGGGLSLALGSVVEQKPRGIFAISPWLDVSLSSTSYQLLADQDPLLSKKSLTHSADLYVNGQDKRQATASPLFGEGCKGTPVIVTIGTNEVFLHENIQYAKKHPEDVSLYVYENMFHVFPLFEELDFSADFHKKFNSFVETYSKI